MNRYEADEILNMAIMSKTPHFIVEGVNDIKIYEAIARSANINCEIFTPDAIEGLAGGNNGVIKAMEALESLKMPPGKKVENHVRGIVDRDARYYRKELPKLPSIFILAYYSIESYFVSKSTIKPSIDRLTRISMGDKVDIDPIFSKIEQKISDLYYFSLDALKKAITPGYESIISYKASAGRRKDLDTVRQLEARKGELDDLSIALGLSQNIESMRTFVKGRWLLAAFTEELFNEIAGLEDYCKNSTINQCRICSLKNNAGCLYKLKGGLSGSSLYSLIDEFVEISDLDQIKYLMKEVSDTATA